MREQAENERKITRKDMGVKLEAMVKENQLRIKSVQELQDQENVSINTIQEQKLASKRTLILQKQETES